MMPFSQTPPELGWGNQRRGTLNPITITNAMVQRKKYFLKKKKKPKSTIQRQEFNLVSSPTSLVQKKERL